VVFFLAGREGAFFLPSLMQSKGLRMCLWEGYIEAWE
jgi:hypothetical protein